MTTPQQQQQIDPFNAFLSQPTPVADRREADRAAAQGQSQEEDSQRELTSQTTSAVLGAGGDRFAIRNNLSFCPKSRKSLKVQEWHIVIGRP